MTTAVNYADLCALRPSPADVDFFLRSAGLRYEYATAEDIAWAEQEALEAAIRFHLTELGVIEWTNVKPMRK